eukprot:m.100476 g.100476  ORF g.100476 m.100476 type:complete len:369 (-) comp8931_c0_seq3:91-1197(-)
MGCTASAVADSALAAGDAAPEPRRRNSDLSSLEKHLRQIEARKSSKELLTGSVEEEKLKHDLPPAFAAKYAVRGLVGIGSFNEVWRIDNIVTKEPFAVKIMPRGGSAQEKSVQTELEVLKMVRHPNVVRFIELFETEKHVFLVMELATGGELFERIMERGVFSEPEAARCIRQVLSGIEYLHQQGIAHRDLKPENLLYFTLHRDSRLMISDFGFAKIVDRSRSQLMNTSCGSPEYIAPEILLGRPYSFAVDLWSLGVITFILLAGYMPFDEKRKPLLFQKIMNAEYEFRKEQWARVSDSGRDFVSKLLVRDPACRMSASQALQHPWIRNYAGGDEYGGAPPRSKNLIHARHVLVRRQALKTISVESHI